MTAVRGISQPLASSKGFSLVELMVAILIGLIILAGVVQVVFTSRTTFFAQEEMSYIQENARYALDILGRDIQGAGYWGCAGQGTSMALVALVGPESAAMFGSDPVLGFEGDPGANQQFPAVYSDRTRPVRDPSGAIQDRPDSIITRRAVGVPLSVVNHNGRTIRLEGPHGFNEGQYLAVVAEDCQRVGIIRASAAEGTELSYNSASVCGNAIKPTVDQNLTCASGGNGLAQSYLPGSVVMEYAAHAYYISESNILTGQPALKRMVLRNGEGREEELALGTEDLEILYGISTDDDGEIEQYRTAEQVADWTQVMTVQISLLFRSQAPTLDAPQEREFLGNIYNDRFMRQVVTATYSLRNRI